MTEKENVKPMIITTEDEKGKKISYTLEFNKESVKFAEDRGFQLADVTRFPMTKVPELFFYAFRMHHPKVAKANTDAIIFGEDGWGGLGGIPDGVVERLIELYDAPFGAMVDSKNSKVAVEL